MARHGANHVIAPLAGSATTMSNNKPPRLAKELRPLAKRYKAKGWRLEPTGGGHIKWIAPNGHVVYSASTPSDWRGVLDLTARLKRVEEAT